jgi:lipoprotein-releasing system permease protein
MFSTESLLSWRYVRSRKSDGFISMVAGFSLVGIALGVATLIVVMAVMNGFRQELVSRILGIDGHINLVATGPDGIANYEALTQQMQGHPLVVQATPMVDAQAMLTVEGYSAGVMVRGLTPESLKQKTQLVEKIPPEALAEFAAGEGIIIGKHLMSRMGLTPGSRIMLLSPAMRHSVLGSLPRSKAWTVLGGFDSGMYEYDANLLLMPLEGAQAMFGKAGHVSAIELTVKDAMQAGFTAMKLEEELPQHIRAMDWQRRHRSLMNALAVERNVMFLILTLIILVAAFNIISSLIMLVKDKAADIAILRTIGMDKLAVLRIFMMTGTAIGVTGTMAGTGLGLAFALNIESIRQWLQSLTGTELFSAEIYFLSTLPARLEWSEVFQVVTMSLVITVLATLYPAWRAASTEPASALKYGR